MASSLASRSTSSASLPPPPPPPPTPPLKSTKPVIIGAETNDEQRHPITGKQRKKFIESNSKSCPGDSKKIKSAKPSFLEKVGKWFSGTKSKDKVKFSVPNDSQVW